jgi:uncharacterized membrane protein YeaQ/YmgE (transglycosylase-associated protein family)
MLDNLFNMIKGMAGDAVVNNPDVPNQHNEEVVAEATNTVAGGLQNLVAGGGLQSILSLFGGGQQQAKSGLMSNPIVSMMIGHFASKLMGKYGLQSNAASGVAQSLIPNVISSLISKTNDPNDKGFTLDGLLNSLTGGHAQQVAQQQQQQEGGFSFQNLISQFAGGGQQGGGGGLMDLVGKLAGGAAQAQQQQRQGGGGGLMDLIKGFIK